MGSESQHLSEVKEMSIGNRRFIVKGTKEAGY